MFFDADSLNKTTVTGNDGGYADYTNMSTDLTMGNEYSIYFSAGFSNSSYTEYYHVYIDYNRDGDFEDSGEEVVTGSSSSDANLTASFTVPTGVSEGTTRMRVTMKYNSAATPCESFSYGEVEDYAVNLTPAGLSWNFGSNENAEEIGNEDSNFILYPNPASNVFTISIPDNSKTQISIYNINGSLVKQIVTENGQNIDISELSTGLYTLKINDGRKLTVKRLIVE